MQNRNFMTLVPAVEPEEFAFLKEFTKDLPDDKFGLFVSLYNNKRKKAETILICTLLGFVLAGGIQRFVIGQIGIGLLYLFTGGLCLIGTIVDLVNHKQLTNEFNRKMAIETMAIVNM